MKPTILVVLAAMAIALVIAGCSQQGNTNAAPATSAAPSANPPATSPPAAPAAAPAATPPAPAPTSANSAGQAATVGSAPAISDSDLNFQDGPAETDTSAVTEPSADTTTLTG